MKPTLLILAAGIGSRYGSLKQMDRFGPSGETITDYSIYDAIRAGFKKVVFVIRENIADEFRETFDKKLDGKIEVEYVFQELGNMPEGVQINPERVKPWGTGHAVLVAKDKIQDPFAVVNADDFFGADAFKTMHQFLTSVQSNDLNTYCMVGYRLENTLSEYGYVSRGICTTDDEQFLETIVERTKISKTKDGIFFENENGEKIPLKANDTTSMNLMGFTPSIFKYAEELFRAFIEKNANELKAEFYLPFIVNQLLTSNTATMKVLETSAKWFGVTYKEDKEVAVTKIQEFVEQGIYPANLWE